MPKREDESTSSVEAPQPKRTKLEDRRAKLEKYKKEKIEKQNERKKVEKPAWRPAGVLTRSMKRSLSDSDMMKGQKTKGKTLGKKKTKSQTKLTKIHEEEKTKPTETLSEASPIKEESNLKLNKLPLPKTECFSPETLKPNKPLPTHVTSTPIRPLDSTGITPKMNKINIKKTEILKETTNDELGFDTTKWIETYNSSVAKLEGYKKNIESWDTNDIDEFWKNHVDRVSGEVILYLGPKSKHSQFGKMAKDPKNDKFKVEKEEDLEAYWDGMVLPSVTHFCIKMEWLNKAESNKWPPSLKEAEPISDIGKSPARPMKKKLKIKTDEEIEAEEKKKKEKAEKAKQRKKDAENRRAEMRKKIMEQRKNMKEQGGVAEVLTEKSANAQSVQPMDQ